VLPLELALRLFPDRALMLEGGMSLLEGELLLLESVLHLLTCAILLAELLLHHSERSGLLCQVSPQLLSLFCTALSRYSSESLSVRKASTRASRAHTAPGTS
jgi:hypothetical protein